jgi:hypothetical protein
MDFKQKYLKYKSKYLELKNQQGSGLASSKEAFNSKINKNYEETITILIRDRDKDLLKFEGKPSKENKEVFESIFEQIRKRIKETKNEKQIDNQQMDWIFKSYLTGTFGEPSSLENYGRYVDTYSSYKILDSNKDAEHPIKPFNNINGLLELEQYLRDNNARLEEISVKKGKEKEAEEYQKELKKKGEGHMRVAYETENVIVYVPLDVDGSRYYGRNTQWCTAAKSDNMFDHYNSKGSLYIIQSKKDFAVKYQLHYKSKQLMDVHDHPITKDVVKSAINEPNLFYNLYEKEIIKEYELKKKIELDSNYLNDFTSDNLLPLLLKMPELETITFGYNFNQPFGTSLQALTNLQTINFGYDFNQPLGTSLQGLTNLQTIKFGHDFNEPLGTSLQGLINLQTITFGHDFNEPLGTSLQGLINLQTITFGYNFYQPLGTSLQGLINLQTINFGYFFNNGDQPLGTSLQGLTNLKIINFGEIFNQPLDTSLEGVTNLQTINFEDSFNRPLGTLLHNITSIQTINFGYNFNRPIDTSFQGVTNLKTINFGYNFNQPLGTSLEGLTNLQTLTFGDNFNNGNQPLGTSLEGLTNLQTLTFCR